MDLDVFDVFDLTSYTFHQLSRGGITGNSVVGSYQALGVFKLRSGLVTNANSENLESGATLHVKPTESFVEALNGKLIGHGITCQDRDYEIVGSTGGKDYHEGDLEHYRLTLNPTDYSFEGSS